MSSSGFVRPNGTDVGRYVRSELYERDGGRIVGHAPASEYLRDARGAIHAGAILTFLDHAGGVCGGLASLPDGWVVTTNLSARLIAREHRGPFRLEAELLRRGRSNVVTSVRAIDEGNHDELVAAGVLTSAILVPENGPPQWERPLRIGTGEALIDAPALRDWLGVRTVDAATVEIDLADELRNPWGILHGGVVASLVDLATEHATNGAGVTDVALHYLAPNRIGPVRATVDGLGARSDGTVCRVEVSDSAVPRVTALAVVTARV